jgi:hypothetical protein
MALMTEPVDKQAEFTARRRRRSIALGVVLGALVLIFYVLTVTKFGPALFERPL